MVGELRRLDAARVSSWVFATNTVGGVFHMIYEIDECTLHARLVQLECSVCLDEPGDDFAMVSQHGQGRPCGALVHLTQTAVQKSC